MVQNEERVKIYLKEINCFDLNEIIILYGTNLKLNFI